MRAIILVAVITLLCASVRARPDSVRGSISIHRRSMDAMKKRSAPSKPPFVGDGELAIFRRGADDGNIAAMMQLVSGMEKMNADWQAQAQQDLEEGKTPPQEETTDQMIKQLAGQSNNDYGATSGLKASSKPSSSSSQNNDEETGSAQKQSSSQQQEEDQAAKKAKQQKDAQAVQQQKDAQAAQQKKAEEDAKAAKKQEQQREQEQELEKQKEQQAAKQKQEAQQKQQQQQQQQQAEQKKQQQEQHQKASSSSSGGLFSGDMTFFDVGLNACGWTDKDSDYIVAASAILWQEMGGDQSNGNPICNRKVRIHKNGKTMEARITDQCPPCSKYSLDMSPSLFQYFEDPDVGRTDMQWEWC